MESKKVWLRAKNRLKYRKSWIKKSKSKKFNRLMISQRKKKQTQMINFDCRIVTISLNSDLNVRMVTIFF